MSSIRERQNEPKRLRQLTAARHIYQKARRARTIRAILSVWIPLVWLALNQVFAQYASWSALYAVIIYPLVMVAIEPYERLQKFRAAQIQELFDTYVLEMAWRSWKAGVAPPTEAVEECRYEDMNVRDWYVGPVDQVPTNLGRLICQRTNISWDSSLRRVYARGVYTILVLILMFIVVTAFRLNLSVEVLVISIMAPVTPVFLTGLREARMQIESAERLERLRSYMIEAWSALMDKYSSDQANQIAYDIQNELFSHRATNNPIAAIFYKLRKPKLEETSEQVAEQLVKEARQRVGVSS